MNHAPSNAPSIAPSNASAMRTPMHATQRTNATHGRVSHQSTNRRLTNAHEQPQTTDASSKEDRMSTLQIPAEYVAKINQLSLAFGKAAHSLTLWARSMALAFSRWNRQLLLIQFHRYPRGTKQHRAAARALFESPMRSVPVKSNKGKR